MNPKILFAFFTLCFLAALSTVNGLRCYACTSSLDGDCAKSSKLNDTMVVTCPTDAKLCFDVKKDEKFFRGCVDIDQCKENKLSDCHTCAEDLCNVSSTFSMFNLGIFAVITALLLALK